jgi:hypothetical protein
VESDKKRFGVPLWAACVAVTLALLAGYIFGTPAMAVYLAAISVWLTVLIAMLQMSCAGFARTLPRG